jgi:hypothetical protein
MQSIPKYFTDNYPSESVPEPQSGPAAGVPSFAVPNGQTSADSTPQPPVDLPSNALPNDFSEATLGALSGGAGWKLGGAGYTMNDNLQFRSTINDAGQFSTELHDGDKPISTPYPSDPRTSGSTK